MNRAAHNLKPLPVWFSGARSVIRGSCWILFLCGALCLPAISYAGDTYGTLLDKRFDPQPKTVSTNGPSVEQSEDATAKVAEFGQALKNRAAKIELGPPPPPAPNTSLGAVIMIASAVTGLIVLKVWFIFSRIQAIRKRKAAEREEEFIKSVVQQPTVVTLLSDLKQRLDPGETLPEAHAAVCKTDSQKANEAELMEAAMQVFESAPLLFSQLRKRFGEIRRNTDPTTQLKSLEEFSQEIRPSNMAAQIPALRSHRLLAIALEGFLKQLSAREDNLTLWRIQLASEALNLLDDLCVPNLAPDLATKPLIRLLVVDDDAVSRHAMVFALRKVFREPDLAGGGEQALELANKNTYDVIFLDIDMPGMDGFELCEKIRKTSINKKTPIVFVTSHNNLESRSKLVTKGAQDLIGKPYLPAEITLKALQLSLHGRLKNGHGDQVEDQASETSKESSSSGALKESPAAV
jgi:CheY-like chemotaxis protein